MLCVALAVASSPVHAADTPESNDAVEGARMELWEGNTHFQAKRWQEALRSFEHSFSLVPSPNTELMMARCLRELGRRAEAAAAYASAAAEANRRVAKGEAKYAQTADAATVEGNAVRAQLGTIQVHVVRPTGVTLTIDKKAVPLSKEGDARVLHDPGTATVAVNDANGAEQRQTVTVQPGATVQMDFAAQPNAARAPIRKPDKTDPPPPTPATPELRHSAKWAWPAAITAGALSAASLGVFIGFGVSSRSTYDDLVTKCGNSPCAAKYRDEADRGAQAQTIANIGLGVAAAAAVATIVFVAVAMAHPDRPVSRVFDGTRLGPL